MGLHLLSVMGLMVWYPCKISSAAATFKLVVSVSANWGFDGAFRVRIDPCNHRPTTGMGESEATPVIRRTGTERAERIVRHIGSLMGDVAGSRAHPRKLPQADEPLIAAWPRIPARHGQGVMRPETHRAGS